MIAAIQKFILEYHSYERQVHSFEPERFVEKQFLLEAILVTSHQQRYITTVINYLKCRMKKRVIVMK